MEDERYCEVYVIARQIGDRFLCPVKVGIAKDSQSRLATLQTSCPFKIGVSHSCGAENREMAMAIERRFHSSMSSERLYGEWFAMSPEGAAIEVGNSYRWFFADKYSGEDLENIIAAYGA